MVKRKKKAFPLYIFLIIGVVVLVAGLLIVAKKYAPTKERMDLNEVYGSDFENGAAVILDGEYLETDAGTDGANGVILGGTPYLKLSFIKENLDNGYV